MPSQLTDHKAKPFFEQPENYLHRRFGIDVRKKILSDLAGRPENQRILDAGAGDGSLSEPYWSANNVVLVDLSESMIDIARKKLSASPEVAANVTLHLADVDSLDFDQIFDLILAMGLLAHVNSVGSTIGTLANALKRSGRLVIQFSHYENVINKIRHLKGSEHGYKLNRIQESKICEVFRVNGLRVLSRISYGLMIPGLGLLGDRALFSLNDWTYRTSHLNWLFTERVYLLEKE